MWGKGKIEQWGFFYRGKLSFWLSQPLGSFWGALWDAGQLDDLHLLRAKPTRCSCYNSPLWGKYCLGFSQCFRLAGNVLGSPGSCSQPAALQLHKPPEPTQQPPGPGKTFRPPKTQLGALRDSLLRGRKSGKPRAAGQAALSKADTASRVQASLQTHLTGAKRALSNSRNVSNSSPAFFWENSLTWIRKASVCKKHYFLLYFQCLKRNPGFASLHCACICTETNVWNALMLYAEAVRFLPWMCPRTCYSHISYREVPAYSNSQRLWVPWAGKQS